MQEGNIFMDRQIVKQSSIRVVDLLRKQKEIVRGIESE